MRLSPYLLLLPLMAQPPAAEPPKAAAGKPVLVFSGKPLALSFECGSKQIEEAGMVCTEEEPCPVYLELSGVEMVGAKLFLAGNFHTDTSILASLLLVSEDEGKSFAEAHPRLPNSLLDQVQARVVRGQVDDAVLAGDDEILQPGLALGPFATPTTRDVGEPEIRQHLPRHADLLMRAAGDELHVDLDGGLASRS